MKIYRNAIVAAMVAMLAVLLAGCTADGVADNRETEYGYVQFKLYKKASYEAADTAAAMSRSGIQEELDYLADACKVMVVLSYGDTAISQTLVLSSADSDRAEFGLRSDKLKLLTGDYRIITYSLFDANDNEIYIETEMDEARNGFSVVSGGLVVHDLTAKVAPRGWVRFSLLKDLSGFDADKWGLSRAADERSRQYTFDEIKYFTVSVQNTKTNAVTEFDRLKMKFSIHFDEDDRESTESGFQTSSSKCDSLLNIPAGTYRIHSYEAFDENKILLESNSSPKEVLFEVKDNSITDVNAEITLYEADEYIKDGYALYEIWKALDGPNWYASGEDDVQGGNWDFNRSPDLWCNQPGVQVHSNGRVARLAINNMAYRGDMPAAIGQLTEMVELYLGTHNDNNGNVSLNYDPTADLSLSITERSRERMSHHKQMLAELHPATQLSMPCAMALNMKDIHIPASRFYDLGYSEDEMFDPSNGRQLQLRPMDMSHGKLTNGLKSLPAEIGNLTKLEYLFIANSPIEELPEELANLTACTDIELYNCPKMTKFPMALAKMPNIISLNISNNSQWPAEEIEAGMKALATGPSGKKIQILYARQNSIKELPEEMSELHAIGLLDLAYNQIETLHPLGKDVAPVQLYLNHNRITKIPLNSDDIFCAIEDTETINFADNLLTEFPGMFTAKSKYVISSVDFSNNRITGFPADFKGINAETFSLACNPITEFPKCLADTDSQVAYIIMRGCRVATIPEGSFSGKYSEQLISFDLSYNMLTDMPDDFSAGGLPFLYGLDLSYNSFSKFPREPLNCMGLTVFAIRAQRDANGDRSLREWPQGLYNHSGLRAFMIGSNDLRKVEDTISPNIFNLDISDNPQIIFDASGICAYWQVGAYNLIYDKTQQIIGCDAMLE